MKYEVSVELENREESYSFGDVAKQANGSAWIKLTAPYRLTTEPFPYPSVLPTAQILLAEVPHSLMWGSDWPHVFIKSAMPNDGDLYNVFSEWVQDKNLLQKILIDNPTLIYGF